MPHPLLRVIQQEAERERRELLARAETRAEAILEEARGETERILHREHPPPQAPPADLRLGEAKVEFLARYRSKVEALRSAVLRQVSDLDRSLRIRLLCGVLEEILSGIEPGVYRLEAPEAFWTALTQGAPFPRGRSLRWTASDTEEVVLRSKDGTLCIRFSPETMVHRYFETEAERVNQLLFGDEFL